MLLVEKGVCQVPIIVDRNAPSATLQAADELAHYIGLTTGARPEVVATPGDDTGLPERGIWVGMQPGLAGVRRDLDFTFSHLEEILIACDGRNLAIVGRDRVTGGKQVEFGSANAVYTFIQKYLGVRWLWPGPEGEDILPTETLSVAPCVYRYHPPLVERRMRRPACKAEAAVATEAWFRRQRVSQYSFNYSGGHAFTQWWDLYHQDHPEYFAMQPDGTRDNICGANVKICPSNPGMQRQWLDNATAALRQDPRVICVSASPNDGSMTGECVCPACQAWDDPHGVMVRLSGKGGSYKSVALTDRYVHFWNILARGLRERFPEREVYVGAYAYGPYTTPPVAGVLEPNVVMGYVGHSPFCNKEYRRKMRTEWEQWARNAAKMVYRPNLFHYSGGWLGLPTVAMDRTLDDFRFLAENHCIGLDIDSLPLCWATQGIQFYLMGQLAYEPLQDGKALLQDYYHRAFGPAASAMEDYFRTLEKAQERVVQRVELSGAAAQKAIGVFQEVYTDAVFHPAARALAKAEAGVGGAGQSLYRRRVAFVRSGFEFTRLQVEIMRVMTAVRESKGTDAAAVKRAIELCNRRNDFYENRTADLYAVQPQEWYHTKRALDDFMGPPSAAFRAAAGLP
jgi:hypothetical protein